MSSETKTGELTAVAGAAHCSANLTPRTDEDHHYMMNGPRIAQSLPNEYLEALLKAASSAESSSNASDQ